MKRTPEHEVVLYTLKRLWSTRSYWRKKAENFLNTGEGAAYFHSQGVMDALQSSCKELAVNWINRRMETDE